MRPRPVRGSSRRSFDEVNRRSAPPRPPLAHPAQYQSIAVNKSSAGLLSPLHSYSYFRMLIERTAKCQDLCKVNISLNVRGRDEEGLGGNYFSSQFGFSLSDLRAADITARMIPLPAAIPLSHLFLPCFQRSYWRFNGWLQILLQEGSSPLLFDPSSQIASGRSWSDGFMCEICNLSLLKVCGRCMRLRETSSSQRLC